MLTSARLHDTVTILRAEEVSGPYNSTVWDWENATPTEEPASVQQIGSTEDVVLQQRTETLWRVFLRPTADLKATDRIQWDGKDLEVVGEPDRPRQRARVHHVEAVVRAVSGG